MAIYEQNIGIADDVFMGMRADADIVMQRLIKSMIERGGADGKLTITIGVELREQKIETENGDARSVVVPNFAHDISSVFQIKDKANGKTNIEEAELVWDEDEKRYVMRPIANAKQASIFDDQYVNAEVVEPAALPGPSNEIADNGGVDSLDDIMNPPESEE